MSLSHIFIKSPKRHFLAQRKHKATQRTQSQTLTELSFTFYPCQGLTLCPLRPQFSLCGNKNVALAKPCGKTTTLLHWIPQRIHPQRSRSRQTHHRNHLGHPRFRIRGVIGYFYPGHVTPIFRHPLNLPLNVPIVVNG